MYRAYYLSGFAYKEMGDTAKAVSSFNTVIDLQNDYDAFIQLGNIYAVKNNPLAEQYYNNALKVQPASTEALYNRGLYFQNKGEVGKAVADYNSILKIDPNYSDAYFNLGYINSVLSANYKEAVKFYSEAIRINDQYAEAFLIVGCVMRNLAIKLQPKKISHRLLVFHRLIKQRRIS
ncbi:MAG: tetratricopeptide repeat protein [Bacteroidetes bacterium]|nr:tetratricopeptide repeat protein [Bacteroidota bacterium]